jgi:hypothetical protein
MTPSAVKTGDSVVAFDLLFAFRAFGRCVALHPMMQHPLGWKWFIKMFGFLALQPFITHYSFH